MPNFYHVQLLLSLDYFKYFYIRICIVGAMAYTAFSNFLYIFICSFVLMLSVLVSIFLQHVSIQHSVCVLG